jgi:hypothetical protein
MMTRLAPQWADARTLPDLGRLVAGWLEGSIPTQPGYHGGPAEETAPLVPVLAAANRAGYVTYTSQPGYDGTGYDGARWQQRPAVEGLVTNGPAAARFIAAARACDGLKVIVQNATRWRCRYDWAEPVSRRRRPSGWDETCGFGVQLSRRELSSMYDGVSREAVRAVQAAWQVTLIDPEWGDRSRLWEMLGGWARP